LRYWWVNQNKTFRQEIAGGFMWSPKQNSDGSRNPFYDFMTEVKTGDIVFSYAQSELIAVGVAVSSAYSSTKPRDFGAAGQIWPDEGWKVDVDFVKAEHRVNPRNHMNIISPLLPEKYSPLQTSGFGHQRYLTSISSELGSILLNLMGSPELVMPVSSIEDLEFDEAEQLVIQNESLRLTERRSLVLARRGQGQFRQRVIIFEKECRVTGVAETDLLIASHIKPWSEANNEERLNGHNGLLLSPHIDKLFDSGFVSFENNGQLLVSPLLDSDVLDKWSIRKDLRVKKFGMDQSYFLEHHRSKVFQAA
jgi:hypothetical protein